MIKILISIVLFLCLPSLLQAMNFNGITLFYKNFLIYLNTGYQIRDLYTNDDTFITDAETWTATALRHGIPYSVCNGSYIVGGFDVLGVPGTDDGVEGYYFERTYNDLPPHNIIYYTMSIWLIDSWDEDPPDIFQFQFDSTIAEGWNIDHHDLTADFCGSPDWSDFNLTVFGKISHSGPSLTLRIISQLNSYAIDESLGFRDINLIFTNSAEGDVNEMCGLSQIPLPSHQCDCSYTEYFDLTFGCAACDESCLSCFGPTAEDCYECQVGYSFVDGKCIKCDESCADCSGPSVDQCTDCPEGMSLFDDRICLLNCEMTAIIGTVLVCDQPCETGQIFDEENQTCLEDCNFPFVKEILASGVKVCLNPCGVNGFLYWDRTCNSLCPFPLQEENDACLYQCEIEEFLFWDGSCQQTCDGSFVSSTFKNRQFCQHPCLDPNDFIYWNGTCKDSCPFPFKTYNDGEARYCDIPCTEGQFLSKDDCVNSCNFPFIAREEDGINYCEFPCSNSEYLYWNGSCLESCPSPYKPSSGGPDVQFCSYLCEQYGDYYYPIRGECLPTCNDPKTPQIEIVDDHTWYVICVDIIRGKGTGGNKDEENPRGPFYFPITAIKIASEKAAKAFMVLDVVMFLVRDSHAMILILVIKILNFIKYMDIRVPPQLVQDFTTFDHTYFYLNFGPDMSEGMREKFASAQLPMVFERAGLHSSFLVNFFKPIASLLIMLGILIFVKIFHRFLIKKVQQHQYVFLKYLLRRIENIFRWNVIVFLVICNIDEVTLFGIIEWKTASTDSAQDVISFILSFVVVIISGFVLAAPFYLLHKISKARFKVLSNQANEPYFNLLKKIEKIQFLWKDFKDSSWSAKSFLSIYIFRIALIYMIIALLYKHPLLQAILLLSQSVMMLIFMCMTKPFLKTLDLIKAVIYEVCMLIVIGNVIILAAFDTGEQLWLFLGDCIMFCNILVCLTGVVFFGIKFGKRGQRIWRIYKSLPKPKVWMKFWLLVIHENDPISEELRRNKKTSTKLNLTGPEKEIERKNLASYEIYLPKPKPDDTPSHNKPSNNDDEFQLSYIPRKNELRIRRSLFRMRMLSSDSEGLAVKTASTFDEEKSPYSANSNENLKLSNKIAMFEEIKKNFQDSSLKAGNEAELKKKNSPQILVNGKSENHIEKKNFWKGLETIKELDSMETSGMKNGQQTKRLAHVGQDTLRGDLSLLSVANKRLSSETMMQKQRKWE